MWGRVLCLPPLKTNVGIKMNKIAIHHIGGRCGNRAIDIPPKFHKDIVNVFYEADTDCLTQIEEVNKKLESECLVFPYCLSDSCKLITFNINYDPFTSSLYDMNPYYKSYYTFLGDHDYIISETTKVMETRKVDTVSMDSIAEKIPIPDFISVDTQGSEYDILVGAKGLLKSNVIAVMAETVFHPINGSGIIFGDLVKFMSEQGFHFAKFLSIHEASAFRAPIGLRGTGFHVATDALFLRKIEDTEDDLMLRKLSFISIVLDHLEYGLECLKKSKGFTTSDKDPTYLRFLSDLEKSVKELPEVYPDTFTSLYPTFEISKARFSNGNSPYKRQIITRIIDPKIQVQGWTDVEMTLIRYGLEKQANLISKYRHVHARSLLRL